MARGRRSAQHLQRCGDPWGPGGYPGAGQELGAAGVSVQCWRVLEWVMPILRGLESHRGKLHIL